MGAFLRQLRVGYGAAIVAGVAYASSSFMVDWLGHPQSAVAAIFPWAFACVEVWLRTRRRLALASLAVVVALQFLAGHAETTLHLGLMLAFYAAVRGLVHDRARWEAIIGMVIAAAIGAALAAVQLIPFLAELHNSTLVSDRLASGAGFAHLQLRELFSWIIPNASGNPGIDGAIGAAPNYLESTGFIGVAALLLGGLGVARACRSQRSGRTRARRPRTPCRRGRLRPSVATGRPAAPALDEQRPPHARRHLSGDGRLRGARFSRCRRYAFAMVGTVVGGGRVGSPRRWSGSPRRGGGAWPDPRRPEWRCRSSAPRPGTGESGSGSSWRPSASWQPCASWERRLSAEVGAEGRPAWPAWCWLRPRSSPAHSNPASRSPMTHLRARQWRG